MIDLPIHIFAIAIASLIVLGCLEGRTYRSMRRATWSQLAWSAVVGGGIYGLCLYDSDILPVWSWHSLIGIVVGTMATVVIGEWYINRHDKVIDTRLTQSGVDEYEDWQTNLHETAHRNRNI